MNNYKKSSWNKGLHTQYIQSLLDNREIWNQNDVWYRKCPNCLSNISSKGKDAFRGCIRLHREKRTCKSCGKKRTKRNLTGEKFGKLTVIGEASYRKTDLAPYWKCKCECGKETEVRAQHLTDGITKSCGNGYHRTGIENHGWNGYEEISGTYYCSIKKGAKRRNIGFDINIQQMWEQFLKQNKKCNFTGIKLDFNKNQRDSNGTASLDRIDSSKGYTVDNIQWVHKTVNTMKSDLNDDEFVDWCQKVSEYKYYGESKQ